MKTLNPMPEVKIKDKGIKMPEPKVGIDDSKKFSGKGNDSDSGVSV